MVVMSGSGYLAAAEPAAPPQSCECSDAELYEIVGIMMDYGICDATVCCGGGGFYMEINSFC
jgi:hypothetical protein